MKVDRVVATQQAMDLIARLRAKHGPLMFHQSSGCCDGGAPMCFREAELLTGDQDRLLGEIGSCPFYMKKDHYAHWEHTQLVIDVVQGRGGMFSLESGEGVRFITRTRVFTDEEFAELELTPS